ncbi:MAG: 50S ribosomal protein L4 [Candidatus Jorgensenbacteria bacterium GW2011_GWB1_50_10]|nr:MAG: 50S ribosomal protein L4 [Candidatus Jorgensenbacteria bacterium GW2011_GWB1_50_10]
MIEIYNIENKKTGKMDLPEEIFQAPWRPALVHQVITAILSNRRRPFAHVKGRGEVRGGGKKPWPQKGTGQARHGSIRSPIWRGGGVTHGPLKERTYEKKINKEMKKQALFSVLSKKLSDQELKIVDEINLKEAKTKILNGILGKFFGQKRSVLIVPKTGNRAVHLAGRNIPKTTVGNPNALNVYDCLVHKYVVFEKDAVADFAGTFKKTK